MNKLALRAIIALNSTLLCLAVFASPLEEIVVTANRTDQLLGSLSSNISTIDDEQLKVIDAVHLNEAMQRVSGAWISRGNGQESLSAIRSPVLTGAGGCGAFLMAQDGISLRAAGFCNVNELFEAHSEIAQRIEVIKGPGPAIYGSNALHGVVNVITPAIATDPGGNVQMEGGPHRYGRVKLGYSSENWRADFSGTTDNGYKDDSGFEQQKLTTKIGSNLGNFDAVTTLSVTNLNQETAGFVQGVDAYKDAGLKRDNPNPEAYRDASSLRLYSKLTRSLANGTTLRITPYLRAVDMEFIQHFLPGQAIEKNEHQSIGFQSSLMYESGLTIGVDTELTSGKLHENQPNPTPGSAFLVATIPAGAHYNYQVDALTLAIFAQYSRPLAENTNLVLGARLERTEYDYNNKMLDGRTKDDGSPCGFGGCRFNRPADRSDQFTNFSPKVGFIHNFNDNQQAYVQLASGYRAPQATELYRLQGGQSSSDIDPVQLDSAELGFRGSLNNVDYDISLYTMRKDNFIFRDTDRRTVDNGETSHKGIELTLNWAISNTLSSNIFWTYARHQYENNPALVSSNISGNDIDTAPRTMGSANIAWQPVNRWRFELEWVHMGEYYMNPENTVKYPGHDLFNLRINADFTDSLSGFIRVMNLTDEDYAERADFGFGSERYFVGEPVSAYVGIRLSL